MELGLRKNEIKLADYDPKWSKVFDETKKELAKQTMIHPDYIQHIGSTSIKGIPAKPIIDILVGVSALEDVEEVLFDQLEAVGFLRLNVKKSDEIVLAKFTDHTYQAKTHFIHLVELDSKKWKTLLFFRDYLNEHADAREKYTRLKQHILLEKDLNIKTYTDRKWPFVEEILSQQINR